MSVAKIIRMCDIKDMEDIVNDVDMDIKVAHMLCVCLCLSTTFIYCFVHLPNVDGRRRFHIIYLKRCRYLDFLKSHRNDFALAYLTLF